MTHQQSLFGHARISAKRTIWPGDVVRLKGGPIFKDGSRWRLRGYWRVVQVFQTLGGMAVTARQVERYGRETVSGRAVTVRITGPDRPSAVIPNTVDRPYRLVQRKRKVKR